MNETLILTMLKSNLNKLSVTSTEEAYLKFLIGTAKDEIEHRGIVLQDSNEDSNLVVMYSAYLYRRRASADDIQMPRMLTSALRNRMLRDKQ